jgi:orotidine-5'-phosphate decarboxylase
MPDWLIPGPPPPPFATEERCTIVETVNHGACPEASLARAEVAPGVTTRLHAVVGTREVYVVRAGRGRVEVDGAVADVGPGDRVVIPPGAPQRITSLGPGPLVFDCLCAPRFRQANYRDLEGAGPEPVAEAGAAPGARPPDRRLIVGLDLPDADAARAMADRLGPAVGFYKVGLGLVASGGLALAAELRATGRAVFLDLKLFDIPATVEAAARGLAATVAPELLTVHGDPHVVRAAVAGRDAAGAATRVLAVTILTALDRADLDAALVAPGDLADLAVERAARAFAAGADGVIASPREAARIRALPAAAGRLIVTPGVRPAGAPSHDQKRVATPAEALAAGADHIVVARPILAAPDPRAAAEAILAAIARA